MCEPVTIGMTILGAASAAMSHQSAVAEADATNDAAAATHDSARQTTINQHTQETRKFVEESRVNVEEGFDATLEKRAAMAAAEVIGGTSGVDGASVDAMIAAEAQKGARNVYRTKDAQENARLDFTAGVNAATDQGNARIAATPFVSGPSALEGVVGTVMGAAQGYTAGGGDFSALKINNGYTGVNPLKGGTPMSVI